MRWSGSNAKKRKKKENGKKKEDFRAHGWGGIMDSKSFQSQINSAFGDFPNDFWQESKIKKPKFDDVKILFGKELCEKKIQECLEDWEKSDENHVKFARSFNMPSKPKLDKLFEKLRNKRSDKKFSISKLEVNCITHIRKSYILKEQKDHSFTPFPTAHLLMFHVSIFNSCLSNNANRRSRELIYLDYHRLEHIEDEIYCLGFQNKPLNHKKNGFFLIEGVCYCDNKEKCEQFVKQARKNYLQSNFEYYRIEPLSGKKICDIVCRIGHPYHYVHDGNCVHPIFFTQLRVSNNKDHQNLDAYPLLIYEQLKKRQRCGACKESCATEVTYNDVLASDSPFFWCKNCFMAFHYKTNGELIYTGFEHQKYEHD